MPLPLDERRRLRELCRRTRLGIVRLVYEAGSGHIGAALSQVEALVALYHRSLRVDGARPDWPERDRFVLSKGHGGLGLAVTLAELGFFPASELGTFGQTGARLGMHMDHTKVPGIEASTGSLGHGLGIAVGMALGARLQGASWRTVCMLSDGELYEGSTWEAALTGAGWRLGRLVAVVDRNRLTMDGRTEEELPLEPLAARWASFGWRTREVDGHDLEALCEVFDEALAGEVVGPPTVVIAETVKGRGVSFMEGEARWHYGALDSARYAEALASIEAMYAGLEEA